MNRGIGIVLGIFVLSILFFAICMTKVRLNEVGVKINLMGDGVVDEDYEPGYYLTIPGLQRMERLDPTVQSFMMGGKGQLETGSLEIRGKDQYTTKFDITILYRISKGKAHLVRKKVGRDHEAISKVVKSKASKSLWDILGSLNTQDFYNVPLREAARNRAKVALGKELDALNLEMIDILIRGIEYDATLEEVLVEKQLLDQRKALTVEAAKLEGELEKTQSIERETEAMVNVIDEEMTQEIRNIEAKTEAEVNRILADADLEAQKMIAEADRHRRTKISEGELAKTEAEAKGDKAINEAYAGTGGEAYITRQLVESIEFGEIEVNTNKINPFDVVQLLEMLGMNIEATKP